jgi:hypothetical protein
MIQPERDAFGISRTVRSGGWRLPLFGLFASIAAVLPVLAARHLPLPDGPAHVGRLGILRDLILSGNGSPFYRFDTFFLPNIAFDLSGLALIGFFAPETVGRIFYAATLLLTLWGPVMLHRVLWGRWSAAPLVVTLILFNLISVLGFFNYLLGLSLVCWALAARLGLQRAYPPLRVACGAACATLLLFCHVAAFGTYAIILAGVALHGVVRRQSSFSELALYGLELAPAVCLYLAMATAGQGHAHFDFPYAATKLGNLVKIGTAAGITADIAFAVAALAIAALLGLYGRPRIDTRMVPGMAMLGLAYFVIPQHIAGGSYVDIRVPIALLLIGAGACDPRLKASPQTSRLLAAIVFLILVKQVSLAVLWRSFDPVIDNVVETLDSLPKGAVILQTECQPGATDMGALYASRQPPLGHVASLAALGKPLFIAQAFAIKGQQPIQVNAEYAPWYELGSSIPGSMCNDRDYYNLLDEIRAVSMSRTEPLPPLYLVLVRPPRPAILASRAPLVASTPLLQIYDVGHL